MANTITASANFTGGLRASRVFDLSTPYNELPGNIFTASGAFANANLAWHGDVTIDNTIQTLDLRSLGLDFFNASGGGGPDTIVFDILYFVFLKHISGDRDVVVRGDAASGQEMPWGIGQFQLNKGAWHIVGRGDPTQFGFAVGTSNKDIEFEKTSTSEIDAVVRVILIGRT